MTSLINSNMCFVLMQWNNNNHEIQVLGTEVPLRTAQLFWIVFERFIFPRVVKLFFE